MKSKDFHSSKLIMIVIVVGMGILLASLVLGDDQDKILTPVPKSDAPEFKLLPTGGSSYRAKITLQPDGITTYVSLFERSVEGEGRFTRKINNVVTSEIYSGETTYNCSPATCEKITLADNSAQYAYDYLPDTIKTIKASATYTGEQTCLAGKCVVWEYKDSAGLQPGTNKLYIDKASQRISQVVSEYKESATKRTIQYEFVPITIKIPPVPSEIPVPF